MNQQVHLPILDPTETKYQLFYEVLMNLREEFHRTGRFDDANAKLDEITKLLAVRMHEAWKGTNRFSVQWLHESAVKAGRPGNIAYALRVLSEQVLSDPMFMLQDGTNMFGPQPSLNIQPTDDSFAEHVVTAVAALPIPDTNTTASELDLLNEAFGHFVRDSFRNHTEDAQYMTPPEVVNAALDMVFADLRASGEIKAILHPTPANPFFIADPTCGVGSFLTGSLQRILAEAKRHELSEAHTSNLLHHYGNTALVGQDKVDRMVRLAYLNLLMFGAGKPQIHNGNSIFGESYLDELTGQVSLIVTNPPFGATCDIKSLAETPGFERRYPMLHTWLHQGKAPSQLDSEIVLIDRALALLKPGGRLLIIVPDSVVSAKSTYAEMRQWLEDNTVLRAVVGLPPVTFAQAGTRTQTHILYLQKLPVPPPQTKVFMAVCDDIGFSVVNRVGVPVKQIEGQNQLPAIAAAYASGAKTDAALEVAEDTPSCTWVAATHLLNGRWTPNFYRPKRLNALNHLSKLESDQFAPKALKDIALITHGDRRLRAVDMEGRVHISVLHVNEDGSLNVKEALEFKPKTPGLVCHPGEVLISKINPRIPRVCVVPDLGTPLACSAEFAILTPQDGLDPYLLAYLLLTPYVQDQIQCLAAGTSSSHNRVKDDELAIVVVPTPVKNSQASEQFSRLAQEIRTNLDAKYKAERSLQQVRSTLQALLSDGS